MTRRKKPPYYQVRNGRAFFELGKQRASKVDMQPSYALGKEGLSAEKAASDLYYEWREKSGKPIPERTLNYKRGTLGHWYVKFREKELWHRKKPETRRKWEYYWPYIDKHLGDKRIDRITPSEFETFHMTMEEQYGDDHRWRVVKLARALYNAAIKYKVVTYSPCYALPNTKPKPRTQHWLASEVAHMVDIASNTKPAMALAIRLAWETLLSPVDVRTLPRKALKTDGQGYYVETERAKTGKPVFAAISDELARDILTYIDGLPITLLPDEPILRTSRSHARYQKARFAIDFANVRTAAFGESEKRWMMDLRRSGNLEADLGGASAEDRAEILANTLHKSKELEETYTPITVAKARKVAEQRAKGREVLAAVSLKSPRHSLKTER